MHNMLRNLNLKMYFPSKAMGLLSFVVLLFAMVAQGQTDLWIQKADLGGGTPGVNRKAAVSFSINGKIYIGLGTNGAGGYYQDMWEYDTISEAWTQKSDLSGPGRAGAFAMVMNNKAIIGTGEITGGARTNTVYKYEPVNDIWTPLSHFSGGVRSYASAFSTGPRGFVVGGDDGNFQSDVWEYNINSDTWIARQAFPGTPRMLAVAFSVGGKGYYGTGEIGANTPSADFWEYDVSTNTWTQVSDYPGGERRAAVGAATNNTGFVGFGRDNSTNVYTHFYSYDPSTDTWTQHEDLIGNGRELSVAAAAGNKVYIGTGYGGSVLKDFYVWDPCAVPQITVHPVGLDVCEGTDVVFTVEISNPGGETYQWLKGGSPVAGETSATLNIAAVTESVEGSYTCEISNSCGTAVSDVALLSVTPIPVDMPTGLLANPDTLCPGNTFDITLSADDNGDNQDTLYWYAVACEGDFVGKGHPLNDDLIVPAPDPLITTDYFVQWKNQCGATDCDTLTIFVKEPATDPTNISRSSDTICYDYNEELYVWTEGGTGDTIAWYLGNVCDNPSAPFLGYGDTLDLFALGIIPTTTSTYSVRYETYCGGDEFNSACLEIDIVVNGEISIAQHPQNKSVCEGADPVKFGVLVNSGASLTNIFYQWYFEGMAISDATLDTLTLTGGVSASDSGYYYVKVYNSCDTLTSDSAHLSVHLEPSILIQPILLDTICEGDSLTLTMQAEGSPELLYQWFHNNVPGLSTDTSLTINPATFAHSGDYFCMVTNGCGVRYTDTVSMEVDTVPFIVQQPVDTIACINGTARFNVGANGTLPIAYQWYKIDGSGNSSIMTGETGLMLEISPVSVADTAFDYYCIVSNECFEGPSSDTVNLFMHAQVAVMDSITSDTNRVCYTYQSYIRLTAFGGEGDSIRWYKDACEGEQIAITADTVLPIQVPETTTTFYARWENPCAVSQCDSITIYVSQDPIAMDSIRFADNHICYNEYDSLLLTAYGGEGDSVYWYANENCDATPFEVTADTFVYVKNLPEVDAVYSAHFGNACGETACVLDTLWINDLLIMLELPYFTMQPRDTAVCEGTRDTIQIKVAGDSPILVQWYENGVAFGGQSLYDTLLIIDPVQYTADYFAELSNGCGNIFSDTITLRAFDTLVINTQPVDKNLCLLDTARFLIEVDHTEFAQFTWYKIGPPDVIVGSGESFEIPNLDYDDEGLYYCLVSDTCGEILSDTILLNMNEIPKIITDPYGATVCEGYFFQFEATLTGDSIVHQWYKDDAPIPNSDTNVLVFDPVLRNDGGIFYMTAANNCGEDATVPVELQVIPLPDMLESIEAVPPYVCPECNYDSLRLYAYGDGGGYGDQIEWYIDEVTIDNIIGYGQVLALELPTQTHVYFARWINSCSGYNSSGGGSGGGGGTPNPDPNAGAISVTVEYVEYPDPPVEVLVDVNNFCADYPDSISLWTIGGEGDTLKWYTIEDPDEFFIGIGDTIKVPAPTDTTIYAARWVNRCGNSDSTTLTVNVVPLPIVEMYTADTICSGRSYKVDSIRQLVEFYESVLWESSSLSGSFDDATLLNPTYTDPGVDIYDTVTVHLIMNTIGLSPCGTRVDTISLLYLPIPKLSISPEITAICRDSSITLTATGGESYIWRPVGNNLQDDDSNPIELSPDESTDYYLIGTNEAKCIDSIVFTLDVYPTPLVDLGDSVLTSYFRSKY